MRSGDREVLIAPPEQRDDGPELLIPVPFHYGRIGELLLEADELEETLEVARRHPEVLATRSGAAQDNVSQKVAHLLARDRAKIEVLEEMGALDFGRIDRAMGAPRTTE